MTDEEDALPFAIALVRAVGLQTDAIEQVLLEGLVLEIRLASLEHARWASVMLKDMEIEAKSWVIGEPSREELRADAPNYLAPGFPWSILFPWRTPTRNCRRCSSSAESSRDPLRRLQERQRARMLWRRVGRLRRRKGIRSSSKRSTMLAAGFRFRASP